MINNLLDDQKVLKHFCSLLTEKEREFKLSLSFLLPSILFFFFFAELFEEENRKFILYRQSYLELHGLFLF